MKTKTKQTTRTGKRIREMGITQRDFSGEWDGRNRGEKVQGRRSMVSRHMVDEER